MAKGDCNDPIYWRISNGSQAIDAFSSRFFNGSDVFTGEGNGTTISASTGPVKDFSIQVKSTTAVATDWSVVLEGSLDNVSFTTILTHAAATGDGVVLASGVNTFPCMYFRSRVTALTLGEATDIVVKILGMQ